MVAQCGTHPRVPKELCKHDRASLGKSQTYGRRKQNQWKDQWSVKTAKTTPTGVGTLMVLGGITQQEGGRGRKSYKGLEQGTYIKFFEVEVRLSQPSIEETVHMFSLNKQNDKWEI